MNLQYLENSSFLIIFFYIPVLGFEITIYLRDGRIKWKSKICLPTVFRNNFSGNLSLLLRTLSWNDFLYYLVKRQYVKVCVVKSTFNETSFNKILCIVSNFPLYITFHFLSGYGGYVFPECRILFLLFISFRCTIKWKSVFLFKDSSLVSKCGPFVHHHSSYK